MKITEKSENNIPKHGIEVEALLNKSHVINMQGGYLTMTAIQEQTGLEKDELVPALRWLLKEGRLDAIQGNGFGAHRYRIKPVSVNNMPEKMEINREKVETRLPNNKKTEVNFIEEGEKNTVNEKDDKPEKLEKKQKKSIGSNIKVKTKMQRKDGKFEKLIPEMAHKIKKMEFTEDVAVIALERRPGSKRVTLRIDDAICLGTAAKEKKSQEKKPKQEKTA